VTLTLIACYPIDMTMVTVIVTAKSNLCYDDEVILTVHG